MGEINANRNNGEPLQGQQLDQKYGIITRFVQRMMNRDYVESAGANILDNPAYEVIPQDDNQTLTRSYSDPSGPDILAFSSIGPGTANIPLPATLNSLTVVWEESSAEGDGTETGYGESVGDNATLSLAIEGSGQSSASLIPDLQWDINPNIAENKPIMVYLFFLASPATLAQVLARLTALAGATVNAWPDFSPQPEVFTCTGQRVDANAKANVQQYVSLGDTTTYTKSQGRAENYSISDSVKTVQLPPTIHGAITIDDTSRTDTVDADASAEITEGTNWPALSQTETAEGAIAASVTPSTLAATPGTTAIPSSGLYLMNIAFSDSPWAGYAQFYCQVFDFADLPS